MDSFIDKLRMNNIFSGTENGGQRPFGMPDFNAGQPNLDFISDYWNRLSAMRNNDKDKDLQRELTLRRAGGQLGNIANSAVGRPVAPSGGIGGGGLYTSTGEINTTKPMDVIYKPPLSETYQGGLLDAKLRDLQLKGDLGYGKLAQGEEKLKQTGELGRGKLEQGQQGLDIKKGQLDVNAFKAAHPGMKFQISKGGNIFGLDPITGKAVDTGVSSGTMSEEDKQNLIGEQQQSNILTRGGVQRGVQELRNQGNLSAIGARGEQQRQTNSERADVRQQLPTQQKVQQINTAHQLLSERPEFSGLIVFDPATGLPQNNADPSSPEFQMINDALYGKAKDINLPSSKSKGSNKNNDPAGIR